MSRKALTLLVLLLVGLPALSTPVMAQLIFPKAYATPDSGYSSNSGTDLIVHNGGVWMATDEGLSVTFDQGETWLRVGKNTGLISEIVSAMHSDGSRLWVATSHPRLYDNDVFSYSDGLSFSDDDGTSWVWTDLEDQQDIEYVEGVYLTIYDITGYIDEERDANWVFSASWAGGFLASNDGGAHFRRIFPSSTDSAQFYSGSTLTETNKGFSCVADSSRSDSLFLWAGTSGGIFQYVFAGPRNKAAQEYINRIALCDDCGDSSYVFYGGRNGITRGLSTGRPYISRFEEDGLPGLSITAIIDFRGRLLVGTADASDGAFTGMVYSDDRGLSYSTLGLTAPFGTGGEDVIGDFMPVGERLYMAAQSHGLYVSADTGLTWERILVDSLEAASLRNTANALAADGDTLWVGTDTGLAMLHLAPAGVIDSLDFHVFGEYDIYADTVSSTKVKRVRVQPFIDSTGVLDSTVVWTINEPLTDDGVRMMGRHNVASDIWQHLQWRVRSYDVNFIGDTAVAMTASGTWYTSSGGNPSAAFPIEQYSGAYVIDSLGGNLVTSMEVRGDTVIFGSNDGHAISTNRGETFTIHRANTDPLIPDFVIHYTAESDLWRGLTGDFIPAMAVQYTGDGEPAQLWVSNRSTVDWPDDNAISVGHSVPVDGDGDDVLPGGEIDHYEWQWEYAYTETFAWNFAFYGDAAFAATDEGLLLFTPNADGAWDMTEIPLQDSLGQPLILEGMPVYGVAVQEPYLWIATADRTVRMRLDDFSDQIPYMVIDSTTSPDEVYAFPVPFSHNLDGAGGGRVDFHFAMEKAGNVTIEIYDFAMNLVTTVVDGRHFPAGIYPTTGSYRPTWDGYSDKGDRVAVGIYYFKVESSSGGTRWGKLAVIP